MRLGEKLNNKKHIRLCTEYFGLIKCLNQKFKGRYACFESPQI